MMMWWAILLVWLGMEGCDALSSAAGYAAGLDLPKLNAAVVVPGFLTGAEDMEPLVRALNDEYGIPTMAVPFPNWHWLPCLGGRSMRPMLERLDHTVRWLAANGGDVNGVPDFEYSYLDCVGDFRDNPGGVFKVGGSSEVDEYPRDVQPRGNFMIPNTDAAGKVALIGHSAGGWISRAYLSQRNYGGRAYNGQSMVHSLVTLGSPHGSAPGPAFSGVEWVNREPVSVPALALSGSGYPGDGSCGKFTQDAYAFCCPYGSDGSSYDGDGVTPVESALALPGAANAFVLEGDITHFPWSDTWGASLVAPELTKYDREMNLPWYGDDIALQQWVPWLQEQIYY